MKGMERLLADRRNEGDRPSFFFFSFRSFFMCLASVSLFFLSLIFWIFLPISHDFSSSLAINSPKFLNFLYLLIFENMLEKGLK